MNRTRNESADIAADSAEKHTGKSRRNGLEPYNLKRLNQAEISNMNRSINIHEIESVKKKKKKNLPANKTLGPNSIKYLKKS